MCDRPHHIECRDPYYIERPARPQVPRLTLSVWRALFAPPELEAPPPASTEAGQGRALPTLPWTATGGEKVREDDWAAALGADPGSERPLWAQRPRRGPT